MKTNLQVGLYSLVGLQFFTVFPEYFISVSAFYVLIVVTLVTYNVYGLLLQRSISECLALILFMSCYLIYNDDLISLSKLNDVSPYFMQGLQSELQDSLVFNNSLKNDFLGFFYKFCICFFSAIYFLVISDSLKEQKLISFEYLLVIVLAIVGLMLMCNCNDLLTAYLTIELSSLAFYILASFRKSSSYSVEAGIKYFITGAVSSAFFLFGSSLIYGATGSINFFDFFDLYCSRDIEEIYFFFDCPDETDVDTILNMLIKIFSYLYVLFSAYEPFDLSFSEIGLTFILFSIFIKLSAAPFHLWSLDVYEGSPTNSTIFFAVISKLSLFVLLTRLCYCGFIEFKECWQFHTLIVGVFSIFVGSFGGLKQRKLKTLIAYSSTSHMGYCLVAFSATSVSVQFIFFYMIVYMLSNLCVWAIILTLRVRRKISLNKYSKELGDLALLRKSNPSLAIALAFTMFSMAGIPPMLGFVAKMSLFIPIVSINYYAVALASILISVVSTFYYIRIVKVLYFENLVVGQLFYPAYGPKVTILSILVFLLIFLFLNPTLLFLLNHKAFYLFFLCS